MEWKFINSKQRKQLEVALELIKSVKSEIDHEHKEFILLTTSEDSIEDAIKAEKVSKS